eukprot:2669699-Rhodomonas_salina.2
MARRLAGLHGGAGEGPGQGSPSSGPHDLACCPMFNGLSLPSLPDMRCRPASIDHTFSLSQPPPFLSSPCNVSRRRSHCSSRDFVGSIADAATGPEGV